MNADNLQRIKKLLLGMAEYYGETLNLSRLQTMANVLGGLSAEDVDRAMREIMCDPKIQRFPLPAVIRARIQATEDVETLAVEAANRIHQALVKIGPFEVPAARAFIGELGWAVVERQGGWENLCENAMSKEIPTRKAQWRELAKALHSRARAGKLNEPPPLPSGPGIERMTALTKQIGKGIG